VASIEVHPSVRHGRAVARALALSLVALALAASAAHAGSWQRPVDGPLLRAFELGADPYARGQHRGVDLGAPPGSPVRGACAGRVSFAGRVPGGGRTVSVRCGELVATYQQLGRIAVRVGQRSLTGARVGVVGRSSDPRTRRPHLHLGAREAASGRYVDR
jgi:murein DD-endopeptidase MepM/ murein hydrolase activator NlpD